MSYARLNDGSVYHFPKLNGPDRPIDVPPDADLLRVVADALLSCLPLFAKSLVKGAMKHRSNPRYAEVNVARLVLARACINRLLTSAQQSDGEGGEDGASRPFEADQPQPDHLLSELQSLQWCVRRGEAEKCPRCESVSWMGHDPHCSLASTLKAEGVDVKMHQPPIH